MRLRAKWTMYKNSDAPVFWVSPCFGYHCSQIFSVLGIPKTLMPATRFAQSLQHNTGVSELSFNPWSHQLFKMPDFILLRLKIVLSLSFPYDFYMFPPKLRKTFTFINNNRGALSCSLCCYHDSETSQSYITIQ